MRVKIIVLALCAAITAAYGNNLFSSSNSLSFSFDYLDTVSHKFFADSVSPFYSLPGMKYHSSQHSTLAFKHKNDSLSLCGYGILSGEAVRNDYAINGFAATCAKVKLGRLDACGELSIYSLDSVSGGTYPSVHFERYFAASDSHIVGVPKFGLHLSQAYWETKNESVYLSGGIKKLRWGPGYKGTLGLSGTTLPPFYVYHAVFNFGNRAAFSSFLATYDDQQSLKTLPGDYTSVFPANGIYEIRFGAGQRLDLKIGRFLQIGLFEHCDSYGVRDLFRYGGPLQIYYVGQNRGSSEVNVFIGGDINLIIKPVRLYFELINDDVTVFDNGGNPDKYGFQAGGIFYHAGILRQAGIEYTHVTKYTYGQGQVFSRHTYWGRSIGWPWGNDQDMLTLHAFFNFGKNIRLLSEFTAARRGNGTLEDNWYADGRPDMDDVPYFPQNAVSIISGLIGVRYQPFSFLDTDLWLRPSWADGQPDHSIHAFCIIRIPTLFRKTIPSHQ